MSVSVVQFNNDDLPQMIRIWNEGVEEGIAFPQDKVLNTNSGKGFFAAQK